MIYLDWAATALPDKNLHEIAREKALSFPGNPSAVHRPGKEAACEIDRARETVAGELGVSKEQLIFTSGGSEANNMVLASLLGKKSDQSVIIGELEHPSFSEPAKRLKSYNIEVVTLRPDQRGIFSPESLSKVISDKTRMVSLLALHNETGVIQPLNELVSAVREQEAEYGRRIHFHSDMVQYWGKIPSEKKDNNLFSLIDSASFSGHKLGAPRGIGALYLREPKRFQPLYTGGGQEFGLRPGTENTGGICAFAEAVKKPFPEHISGLMKLLIDGLQKMGGVKIIPGARLDYPELYSPSILSVSFVPVPGEVMVRLLDEKGFAVSTGSACSTNKKEKLLSLKAMGVGDKERFSAIRISLGETTTEKEISEFLETIEEIYSLQKKLLG